MGRQRIIRTEEELAELREKQRAYQRWWSKNHKATKIQRERRSEKLRLRYRNDEQWAESRRQYQREKWRLDNGYYKRHPDKLKQNLNGTDIELQGRIPELVSRNKDIEHPQCKMVLQIQVDPHADHQHTCQPISGKHSNKTTC